MELKCKHCGEIGLIEKRGVTSTLMQRIKCLACGRWSRIPVDTEPPVFVKTEDELTKLTGKDTYIITSAQNGTPLDKKFWKGLNNLAGLYNAQLLVIPVFYHTRTKEEDIWFPKEVQPYLVQNDIKLPFGVRIMGNVRVAATAVNPLTGFESLTQGDSAIFGHAQIQMRTIATPQNRLPKILTTTGSTSTKNYSDTKAGIKGDFHHSLGAVVVELDHELEIAHIRNITGDNDSEFYDLHLHVNDRRIKTVSSIPALVTGDEHHMFISEEVTSATYTGDDSMVKLLRPNYLVRHDIIDSYSISHHHRNSPSIRYAKELNKTNSLEDELKISAKYLEATTPANSTNVIVMSNHHNHIKQWLEESDWRSDMVNAEIYHEMWAAWIRAIKAQQTFHPFIWWMKANCVAHSLYLTDDYPFIVKGIYLGYHGDRGPNGSKGSIKNLSKIGAKTVIGHFHSPGIEKGAYQVGVSTESKLEYTSGPSSWMNTHCLVHSNGKRQLVHIIKGEYRLARN